MRFFFLILILAGQVSKASDNEVDAFSLNNVSIVERNDPMVDPGVMRTWSHFVVRLQTKETVDLYAVFIDPLPRIGETCEIEGYWGKVDMLKGGSTEMIGRARIIRKHTCK